MCAWLMPLGAGVLCTGAAGAAENFGQDEAAHLTGIKGLIGKMTVR